LHKITHGITFIKIYILFSRGLIMDYEKLLDETYEKVKQVDISSDRFEIPKIQGHFEGKKTILTNFFQIASHIRRTPEHFQKFMLRELAASGQREGDRLILNIKVPSEKINQKVEEYVKEFVLCKECGKPDTKLIKEDRLTFVQCLACGAKHSVRGKI
jgi:translation initiation factor 2 subunit 2